MQVFRIRDDGDTFLPHKNRQGKFVLGDPKHGPKKHHKDFKVYAGSIVEAVKLVEMQGFSLWMKGQKSKQVNLISPDEIQIVRQGSQ